MMHSERFTLALIRGILCLAMIGMVTACNHDDQSRKNPERIEISAQNKSYKLSQIFESDYELIKLQTNSDNKIGIVNKIRFWKDRIYILDNTNTIYSFLRDGTYIDKLSNIGRGPEEYIMIMSFQVQDFDTRCEIVINDPVSRKIVRYSQDFKFIDFEELPFPFYDFVITSSGTMVYYRGLMTGTEDMYNYDLILENPEGEGFIKFFPYEFHNLTHGKAHPFTYSNNSLLFHTNYSDIIYEIDEQGSVIPRFHILFGDYKYPSKEFFLENKDKKTASKEILNSSMVYSYDFKEVSDQLFLSFYVEKSRYLFIKDHYRNQLLTNDYKDDFGFRLCNDNVDFFDGDKFGFIIYPFMLEDEKKDHTIPLNQSIRSLSLEDNPALVLFRLKSKIEL